MKQICPIHHFAYSGAKCPYCEKERLDELAHRFVKKHEENPNVVGNFKIQERYKNPITDDDLKKLATKFNIRKKSK